MSSERVSVEMRGVEIEVVGEVVPYLTAKITADPSNSYPAEGGGFDRVDVSIEIGGEDVTELFWNYVCPTTKTPLAEEIINLAEEKLSVQNNLDRV